MKLWVLSDLHLEFSPLTDLLVPDADVCLVAGDVLDKGIVRSLEWLDKNLAVHMPVVFCAGNHEFYRAFFRESLEAARAFTGSGRTHFLEDRSVTIGDIEFCGATLWSDFEALGHDLAEVARRTAAAEMNDYRLVKYSKKPFKPLYSQHTFQKHAASRRFLEERRSGLRDRKLVFLTHHAPSLKSVEQPRQAEVLTAAYASDLEYLMKDGRGPNLWVHGHLHNKSDYLVGSTRVVSNPRGYPGEPSYQAFDAGFVVVV